MRQRPAEPGWGSTRSGGRAEGDSVAEGLQAADVVADGALGAAAGVVEVRAEVDEVGLGVGRVGAR